jgi:hypothetical protein
MTTQPLSMIDMNTLIARAFFRIHGRDAPLELPLWWASQVRAVITQQDDHDKMRAAAKWSSLTRRQQQDRLLAHLTRMPSAETNQVGTNRWPMAILTRAR